MPPMRSRRNSRNSTSSSPGHKILEKLLDFLDSTIWLLPIETFVEQQSIVFDRQQDDSELYMKVHLEFANLVDTLLECFCEDVGIRAEELISALEKIDKEKLSARAKAAYEPLAAAQNYAVFVPMMMRKNVELQLQALQMIEFMCGIIPGVLKVEEDDSLREKVVANLSGEDAEKYVLMTVLRQSRDEFDAAQHGEKKEIEAMLRAENFAKDRERLMEEQEKEEKNVQEALALPTANPPPTRKDSRPSLPVQPVQPLQQKGAETKESQLKESQPPAEDKRERVKNRGREDSREAAAKERPPSRAPSAKGERKISVDRKMSTSAAAAAAAAAVPAATVAVATAAAAAAGAAAPEKRPSTSGERKLPRTASGERKPSVTRPGAAKVKRPLGRKSSSQKSSSITDPSMDSIDDVFEGAKGRTAADIRALLQAGDELDPEVIAARAAYLREQRSKLTQMKNMEREKQLMANSSGTQERPKTAKAARGMMRGGRGEGGGEEIMAARRALVEKLKEAV